MGKREELLTTVALVVLLLLGGASCDEPAVPDAPPVKVLQPGTGVIRGVVKFSGTPPPVRVVDDAPCHDGARPPPADESVVVNPDGTLANVVVYVAGVASDAPSPVADKPVLDQVDCRYVPHVLAARVGQPVVVRSSDPTLHNVHYDPRHNPPANFGMTAAGAERVVTFANPEVGIRVRCDVHPWMTAYVAVFDHPWFAVTPAGRGTFEIGSLPAGTFTLVAWHERYGTLERQITVEPGKTVDPVEFEYRNPG